MNLPAPPTGLYPEDYDRIEAAVMETVRGRWFLLEYARRQRAAETDRLVQAVDRLERYAAARIEAAEEPEAPPAGEWRLPRRLAERAREFAAALRASGLDETFCAQADALAEQFAAYAEPAPPAAAEISAVPRVETATETPAAADERPHDGEAGEERMRSQPAAAEIGREIASPALGANETIASEPIVFEEAEWSEPVATAEDEAAAEEIDLRKWEAEAAADAVEDEIITDPRHAALSRLDHLSLHEKLRLFG
jgi:hypothetical protein